MEQVGLMPSDTGQPGGRRVGERVADYAMEGGAFLAACQELVTEQFTISWLDRFPSSKQVALAENLPSLDLPVEAGGGAPAIRQLQQQAEGMAEAFSGAGAAGELPVVVALAAKSQTRARYVCGCDNIVWGRPGLKLICGGCSDEYISG